MTLNIVNLDDKRKDKLLNASLKEFALKGYDDASTNVIAKESGISKALMFHYIKSKKELFFYLYDYCTDTINKEYLKQMNFDEKDIFKRLRQSYVLQIALLRKHAWLFDFTKLSFLTKSIEINEVLAKKAKQKEPMCYDIIFQSIDESYFREELDIERCKQLIIWGNIGYTNQLLENIRTSKSSKLDHEEIIANLDKYFEELRIIFYK